MRPLRSFAVAVAVLALLATGCALTSKAPPLDVRYFTPEVVTTRAASLEEGAAERHESRPPAKVCLGRVTSSNFLRTQIVYRVSAYEVGAYDDLRWTEYPEVYLRRALRRSLFDEGRLQEGSAGGCPSLDVDLLGFEEARHGSSRAGRVQIVYRLHDGPTLLASDVVTVERAATGGAGMVATVAAIGAALDEATLRLATSVEVRLSPATEPRE